MATAGHVPQATRGRPRRPPRCSPAGAVHTARARRRRHTAADSSSAGSSRGKSALPVGRAAGRRWHRPSTMRAGAAPCASAAGAIMIRRAAPATSASTGGVFDQRSQHPLRLDRGSTHRPSRCGTAPHAGTPLHASTACSNSAPALEVIRPPPKRATRRRRPTRGNSSWIGVQTRGCLPVWRESIVITTLYDHRQSLVSTTCAPNPRQALAGTPSPRAALAGPRRARLARRSHIGNMLAPRALNEPCAALIRAALGATRGFTTGS